MEFITGMIVGSFIGASVGVFVVALCMVAGDDR